MGLQTGNQLQEYQEKGFKLFEYHKNVFKQSNEMKSSNMTGTE